MRFSETSLIYDKNGHRPLPLPRPKENSTVERPCQQTESAFHWVYNSSQVRVSLLGLIQRLPPIFPWRIFFHCPENRGILTHFMSHVSFYSPWKQKTTKWSNTLKQFVDCCQQMVWVCLTILWFSNVFRAFQGFFQVFFHITGFVFQIKFVKVPRPFLAPKTWRNQQGVCRAL